MGMVSGNGRGGGAWAMGTRIGNRTQDNLLRGVKRFEGPRSNGPTDLCNLPTSGVSEEFPVKCLYVFDFPDCLFSLLIPPSLFMFLSVGCPQADFTLCE